MPYPCIGPDASDAKYEEIQRSLDEREGLCRHGLLPLDGVGKKRFAAPGRP